MIITSTAGELRAALARQRDGHQPAARAEVFFLDQRRGAVIVGACRPVSRPRRAPTPSVRSGPQGRAPRM